MDWRFKEPTAPSGFVGICPCCTQAVHDRDAEDVDEYIAKEQQALAAEQERADLAEAAHKSALSALSSTNAWDIKLRRALAKATGRKGIPESSEMLSEFERLADARDAAIEREAARVARHEVRVLETDLAAERETVERLNRLADRWKEKADETQEAYDAERERADVAEHNAREFAALAQEERERADENKRLSVANGRLAAEVGAIAERRKTQRDAAIERAERWKQSSNHASDEARDLGAELQAANERAKRAEAKMSNWSVEDVLKYTDPKADERMKTLDHEWSKACDRWKARVEAAEAALHTAKADVEHWQAEARGLREALDKAETELKRNRRWERERLQRIGDLEES